MWNGRNAQVLLALAIVTFMAGVGARGTLGGAGSMKVLELQGGGSVDIEVTQWPAWTNLGKGVDNKLADTDNGNPLVVTIKSTTNVTISISMKGSDNLEVTGIDYIGIGNVVVDNTQNDGNPSGNAFVLTISYQSVTWMQNIPPPGTDENRYAYFYITTRADQHAGTYAGTLYVKATEVI